MILAPARSEENHFPRAATPNKLFWSIWNFRGPVVLRRIRDRTNGEDMGNDASF